MRPVPEPLAGPVPRRGRPAVQGLRCDDAATAPQANRQNAHSDNLDTNDRTAPGAGVRPWSARMRCTWDAPRWRAPFIPGDIVRICNQTENQINGERGVVRLWHATHQKFVVQLATGAIALMAASSLAREG